MNGNAFQELLRAKKAFIVPVTLSFLVFYFSLPVLTSYFPQWMNIRVMGHISIAWLLAFAQFVMTWAVSLLYINKARRFDKIVLELKNQIALQGKARDQQ